MLACFLARRALQGYRAPPQPHGRAVPMAWPTTRRGTTRLGRWALPATTRLGGPWRRPARFPGTAARILASGRRLLGDLPSPLPWRVPPPTAANNPSSATRGQPARRRVQPVREALRAAGRPASPCVDELNREGDRGRRC
jgi:hypothetical protein